MRREERILEALLNDEEYSGNGVTKKEKLLAELTRRQAGNGDGVRTWDDLEGKPFGTEENENIILTNYKAFITGESPDYVTSATKQLELGKTYIVTHNDVEYECVAKTNTFTTGKFAVYVGNPEHSLGGIYSGYDVQGEGNNEPFLICNNNSGTALLGIMGDLTYGKPVISIIEKETVTTPLPVEYLPEHTHTWESLERKPFGEETTKLVTIVPEVTETFYNTGGSSPQMTKLTPVSDYVPQEGDEIVVTLNGETYRKTLGAIYDYGFMELSCWVPVDSAFIIVYYGFGGIGTGWVGQSSSSTVEATISISKEEAAETQLSEAYIPTTVPRLSAAEVGQIIKVSAVDDEGVPTEWEAVDMPESGGFRINVTTNDSDEYVSDKTYAEITEAIAKGLIPYVVCGEYILQWHKTVGMGEIATYMTESNGHHFSRITMYDYINVSISEDYVEYYEETFNLANL